MKKFTIHFQGRKIRAKQGAPNGEPVLVDEWENTIQSNEPAAIWHLTDFAYLRHGVAGIRFCCVPGSPGLFRSRRMEERSGWENSKGHYLALFEVQIAASHNYPTVRIGDFNLPPER
jgi:hypothetical protein